MQQIVLEMPAAFDFRAGQYLEVIHPDGRIALSIASGPLRLPELHLHYRSTPGVAEAAWLDELLAAGRPLIVRGPSGDVFMPDDPEIPMLLIAGGTGIAQVCAILDEVGEHESRAPVTVLWCADADDELYCRSRLEAVRAPWLHVEFIVDARRDAANAGLRRIGDLAASAAARHRGAPAGWILLAGSPGFTYAACDVLVAASIDESRIHSDVFAYAPRPRAPGR